MTRSYVADAKLNKMKIFKDDDPPSFRSSVSPWHKHEYAEVHLTAVGKAECTVEGVLYENCRGDALLIPAGKYHSVVTPNLEMAHFSFQAELSEKDVRKVHFPPEFIKDLFDKLSSGDKCLGTLSYICTELSGTDYYRPETLQDYRHAIGNFFDRRHHENIGVDDLASELHLSRMHTQRLVKKYTGMTFGENVRKYRLRVGEYLMKNTDMTKEKIAEYVGYSSYSGFWKAMKKEKSQGSNSE